MDKKRRSRSWAKVFGEKKKDWYKIRVLGCVLFCMAIALLLLGYWIISLVPLALCILITVYHIRDDRSG